MSPRTPKYFTQTQFKSRHSLDVIPGLAVLLTQSIYFIDNLLSLCNISLCNILLTIVLTVFEVIDFEVV